MTAQRTQRDVVLGLLADGHWHSTIEFVELGILRAAARVFELRTRGHAIELRRRRFGRGQTVFEYRLHVGTALHGVEADDSPDPVQRELDYYRAKAAE